MVTCLVFENGGLHTEVPVDDLDGYVARPGCVLWVDLSEPEEDDFEMLQREFGFHPLSLEDAKKHVQRPKIEEYEGYFFLVTQALLFDAENLEVRFSEVDFFVGRNFVVTVHDKPLTALRESMLRCQRNPMILSEGVGFVVYTIVDSIIDEYLPVLDTIDDRVDDLEEDIFHDFDETAVERIFTLKRSLLQIRRNSGHMRDVFNVLMRRDQPLFTPQTVIYFRDIYDHLFRITDSVDIYRDILTGALDAWLSLNANRLNTVMKTFAGLSIMLMTAALVAGIYGMNFVHIPELQWLGGYPFALGLMVVLVLAEYAIFRRKGWL